MTTTVTAPVYRLRRQTIEDVLDRHAWSQEGLAQTIGIHRVTLTRALSGRPLSRRMRRKLLECDVLRGLTPDDLWDRVKTGQE